MASFSDQVNPGSFIPTTSIFEIQRLREADPKSDEFKELLVKLYETVNNIALVLNTKDSAYYPLTEFVNGQIFFPNPALSSLTGQTPVDRQVFRKVINFGSLPNTATKSVAHGLGTGGTISSSAFTFTRIYGCASDTTGFSYIPIPYASPTLANNISIDIDSTNVNITTGSNRTNYDTTYVIVELLKQ